MSNGRNGLSQGRQSVADEFNGTNYSSSKMSVRDKDMLKDVKP